MSAKKKSKLPAKSTSKSSTKSVSSDPMNLDLLEEMVKLMSQHDLNTVDVRNGDRRIVLKRGAPPSPTPTYASPSYAPPTPSSSQPSPSTPPSPTTPTDSDAGLLPIKSPMVGTFYAAPTPDAKPFVQVGTQIDEDTDVCVIEAMKVFNSIKSETRGTIAKVLVANGSTVEFGQVLFLVKP